MPQKPPKIGQFALTAFEDVPDFRDWVYEPALIQLKKSLPRPRRLSILDQGVEGACTGFGLAAVINLLNRRLTFLDNNMCADLATLQFVIQIELIVWQHNL